MSIPKYYEMYRAFLTAIDDGKTHKLKEVKERIIHEFKLTDEDINEMLPSGKQAVLPNRIGWARTYLKKAGLIESPARAEFKITEEGKKVLNSGVEITDNYLADNYPEFADFKNGKKSDANDTVQNTASQGQTPQETLDSMYDAINSQLADDLLTEIMTMSPTFFENLVVELMEAMGYGKGFVTKSTSDGGIDGIIHEDRLGFNLIYIQAKRWKTDTVVSRPEIQKFAGAMMGPPKVEKGLYITTASFSQGAIDFAEAQHIILVDGQKLANLMIEHNLGVSVEKVYSIKRIDSDYFNEN